MSFIGSMLTTAIAGTLAEGGIAAAIGAGLGEAGSAALAGALGQGIAGAGIGALGSAVTGGDPGEGALMGGVTGGLLGGLGGLGSSLNATEASMAGQTGQTLSGAAGTPAQGVQAVSSPVSVTPPAGSANGAFNAASSSATQFANANPALQSATGQIGVNAQQAAAQAMSPNMFANQGSLSGIGDLAQGYANMGTLGKAGVGLGVGLGVNALTPSGPSIEDARNAANAADREQYLRYMRAYRPSLAPGYAAGGITDLDGYMSNAQNIPNSNEVADPEGYPTGSVKMMAGGGLSSLFPGGQGGADWMAKNSLPGMIFGWKGASDVPLIGSMFNDPNTASLSPEEKKKLMAMAAVQGQPAPAQTMAHGGIADLGGYSKGGNLLAGPGDGVSDDIPASIAGRQPARLAAGEYVVPSRIVSELGNGSTDAGAKRLDAMVQKINAGRAKTLGGKKYAADTRAYKHLPV